jgi:hypothetical protein
MKAPAGWLQQFLSKKLDVKTMADALEFNGVEV